jgi:hypothetical protein
MRQDDPGLEQRLSRFEAQLDRFSLALHQWREVQGSTLPARAPDLDERLRALEEAVTREAQGLKQFHEEPLKQLLAQTEGLGELSRSLHTLIADLRLGIAPAAPSQGSAASWPLEGVVHLHDELRRTSNGGNGATHSQALPADTPRTPSRRVRLLQAGEESPGEPIGRRPLTRWRFVSGVLAAGAVIALTIFGVRRIEARLDDASARVAVAERQVVETTRLANQEVTAARQDADRQITEARQLAQRAETVGAVLTAPDLIRFNLTSVETVGPSAQLLWSRTRGLVLSGSRLPAAPPESTYQLWLVTKSQSVGAGLFVPDDAGRATLVVDAPPRVSGAVVGAAVTIEPSGGRPTPSGRTLLARFP